MKSIVITGVSTGIGFGAAKEFVTHGYQVFGSVRREADAARLQADLGDNFTPLIFDLTDSEAVRAAACQVAASIRYIGRCRRPTQRNG